MPKLRAAAVSFLNAWPLTAGLESSERIELVLAEPSRCAAMLDAGEVDLALVSVGALPGGEFDIVPGIAIGADGDEGEVHLARLEHRGAPRGLREHQLDAVGLLEAGGERPRVQEGDGGGAELRHSRLGGGEGRGHAP